MNRRCLKTLCALLSLMIAFSCFGSFAFADDPAENAPILIHNIEELRAIEENLSGNYKLANNIVANKDEEFYAIGSKVKMFTGTFDGDGYFISGLKLSAKAEDGAQSAYIGLFGYNAGVIKNVMLTDLSVSLPKLSWLHIGGIAGGNTVLSDRLDGGVITNCFAEGIFNVDAGDVWVRVGGIVSASERGEISNCVSEVNVSYQGKSSIDVGGISSCNGGTVRDCSNRGNISVVTSRDAQIGGISALAKGKQSAPSTIENCVNLGKISVESDMTLTVGGIVGRMYLGNNYAVVSKTISAGEIYKKANFSSGFNPSMGLLAFGAVVGEFQGEGTDNYYLDGVFEKPVGNGMLTTALASTGELRKKFSENHGFYLPTDENAAPDIAAYKKLKSLTSGGFYENYVNISKPLEILALYDDGTTAPIKPYISLSIVPYNVLYRGKTLCGYVGGDVDYSGTLTVTDVVNIRAQILNPTPDDYKTVAPADYNSDGTVSVTDITALLNTILTQE